MATASNPTEVGRPRHYDDAEIVREYHKRYASGIDRWKHERKLRVLKRWVASSPRVLEVACGPGRWFEVFRNSDSVHCDLSRPMLERFRQMAPEAKLVRAEGNLLPFPDSAFDAVVCIRFIAHLRGEYRAAVLRELVRVCRREVIIDARHLYNFRYWSRWIRRRLGVAHADKLRHTMSELRAELERVGLDVSEARSVAWGFSGRILLRAVKRIPELPGV